MSKEGDENWTKNQQI